MVDSKENDKFDLGVKGLTVNVNVVQCIQVEWILIKGCCKLWLCNQNVDGL